MKSKHRNPQNTMGVFHIHNKIKTVMKLLKQTNIRSAYKTNITIVRILNIKENN
jgi:hypothetical protein